MVLILYPLQACSDSTDTVCQQRVELQLFREDLGNIKPLLHSTSPNSFVGILSW